MQTNAIEWGADINAANGGKKLNWLSDDDLAMCHWGHEAEGEFAGPYECRHISGWTEGFHIRLPADHWAYPVIAAGFEPWGGGDTAPGDWDGKACMMRIGRLLECAYDNQPRWTNLSGMCDIIGYRRKVETGSEVWERALGNTPSPTDTVTIPTMTEEEAREKAEAHCEDYEWDNGYVQAIRDLGLIRPATLLDQFEAYHGGLDDNQRAIIEIYQEWVAAQ